MLTHEIVGNPRLLGYPRSTLLKFKQTSDLKRQQTQNDLKIVEELMKEFGQKSTIHGMSRIFSPKVGGKERLLWIIGFFVALGTLSFVIVFLAKRYNRAQFQTIVSTTNYPLFKIEFPEVIICNENRLNWARFEEARAKFLQPAHQQNAKLSNLFTKIVALYDTFNIYRLEYFSNFSQDSLRPLNYINFTEVLEHLSWRCEELLGDCFWRHRPLNCCKIFLVRRSSMGICWAFNAIETDAAKALMSQDPMWPWRASKAGSGNGLMVKVYIKERLHSPFARNAKGVSFMVLEPGVWSNVPIRVLTGTKTNVRFEVELSYYDNQTLGVPSTVRQCVFPEESEVRGFKSLRGLKYMIENCRAECQQEHMMKLCNCTAHIFFPPSHYPSCKLVDMPCMAQHSNRFLHFVQREDEAKYVSKSSDGIACQCYVNCVSQAHLLDIFSILLPSQDVTPNDSHIEMDFYFKRDWIHVYRTNFIYTWVDLLASFGGAVMLFLGCSLISFVELFYYFLVYLPKRLWSARHTLKDVMGSN